MKQNIEGNEFSSSKWHLGLQNISVLKLFSSTPSPPLLPCFIYFFIYFSESVHLLSCTHRMFHKESYIDREERSKAESQKGGMAE